MKVINLKRLLSETPVVNTKVIQVIQGGGVTQKCQRKKCQQEEEEVKLAVQKMFHKLYQRKEKTKEDKTTTRKCVKQVDASSQVDELDLNIENINNSEGFENIFEDIDGVITDLKELCQENYNDIFHGDDF